MHLLRVGQIEAEISAREVIIEEVALDYPTLVANAEDEPAKAMPGKSLHDVPENWPAANGNHWLGNVVGHIADAGALAPAENDNVHGVGSLPCAVWAIGESVAS